MKTIKFPRQTVPAAGSPVQRLVAFDKARAGIPGEHWLVLAAGLAAWGLTRRHPSFVVRTLGMMAGTAMLGRAASGRDGLRRVLRLLPVGRNIR